MGGARTVLPPSCLLRLLRHHISAKFAMLGIVLDMADKVSYSIERVSLRKGGSAGYAPQPLSDLCLRP